MPCRTCNGKVTREQAAAGVCPNCGSPLHHGRSTGGSTLPPRSGEVRNRKPQRSLNSSGQAKWIIGGALVASVALLGIAGFAVARAFFANAKALDTAEVRAANPPSFPTALLPAPVTPNDSEPPVPVQPAAADPTLAMQSNVAELLRQQHIAERDDIVRRVDQALKIVQEVGHGHVIVGRLKMDGNASPRDVISQMEILEDGYFVDAVATAGAPVYFWHPGYDRLEVIPQGQQGSVEFLGEVMMMMSSKPGGVVKGILVALPEANISTSSEFGGRVKNNSAVDGTQVPKDLKGTVDYSIPLFNHCGTDTQARSTLLDNLRTRMKLAGAVSVVIVPETGEFTISNLPELTSHLLFSTAIQDFYWTADIEIAPGEETDLQLCTMLQMQVEQPTEPGFENQEWAPDGKMKVEEILEELQRDNGESQFLKSYRYDEVVRGVENLRNKGGDERNAVAIFGRIDAPGRQLGASGIQAQMVISPSGYFFTAARPGRPVGFRAHGYDPLDYMPKGSHDGVEYCGVLRMKKTLKRDQASVQGSVTFEGGQPPRDFYVFGAEDRANINWPKGFAPMPFGQGGSSPKTAIRENQFEISELSPIDYTIRFMGSGFVNHAQRFQFQPGERRTLAPILLFRARSVMLTHLASKSGNFAGAAMKTSVIASALGNSHSFDDPDVDQPTGEDLSFRQRGRVVTISSSSCYLLDLGKGSLEEYRSINGEAAMPSTADAVMPSRYAYGMFSEIPIREGHVYLLKQWHWKHWRLFKVDGIMLAPMN